MVCQKRRRPPTPSGSEDYKFRWETSSSESESDDEGDASTSLDADVDNSMIYSEAETSFGEQEGGVLQAPVPNSPDTEDDEESDSNRTETGRAYTPESLGYASEEESTDSERTEPGGAATYLPASSRATSDEEEEYDETESGSSGAESVTYERGLLVFSSDEEGAGEEVVTGELGLGRRVSSLEYQSLESLEGEGDEQTTVSATTTENTPNQGVRRNAHLEANAIMSRASAWAGPYYDIDRHRKSS